MTSVKPSEAEDGCSARTGGFHFFALRVLYGQEIRLKRGITHMTSLTKDLVGSREITIVGTGTSGAVVFQALFKLLGVQDWSGVIRLYDPDRYERRNRNQFVPRKFRTGSLEGKPWPKVFAQAHFAHEMDDERVVIVHTEEELAKLRSLSEYSDKLLILPKHEAVTAQTKLRGIVICCVDYMPPRKQAVWPAVLNNGDEESVFVDIRIGLEGFRSYVLYPNNAGHIHHYTSQDHSPDDPPDLVPACDAERPSMEIAMLACGTAIRQLIAALKLDQGSTDPVPNYWGQDFESAEFQGCRAPLISLEYWDHGLPILKVTPSPADTEGVC